MVCWNTNGRNFAVRLEMNSTNNTQKNESVKPTVPWTGFDVLLFLAIWMAPLLASIAIALFASQPQSAEATQYHGHPVAQLIVLSKKTPVVFLVVFLAAVVVAPIIEEFMFRMLFQGWLEAKFKQLQMPCASGIAIVIVAFCFAAIHASNHGAIDAQTVLTNLVVSSVYSMLVFSAGIICLHRVRNVRIADYLFVSERFVRPRFFSCVGYCLLTIVSIYGLQVALVAMCPGTNVSPISIFFFALALGILYSRTQNLSDCILFHACLNGISLVFVWYISSAA